MVSKEFEKIYAKDHKDRDPNELIARAHAEELKELQVRHERHLRRHQAPAKKAS